MADDDIVEAIGIDFGTTYSCVSYYNKSNKVVECIENDYGNYVSPTIIFFDKFSDTILFGEEAQHMSRYKGVCTTNWKRIIGKKYNELSQFELDFYNEKGMTITNKNNEVLFEIKYNNQILYYSSFDLSVLYIKWLKSLISKKTQNTYNLVFTIPSYFNDNSRQELKKAFEKNGFIIIRILNEPTASSLAYVNDNEIENVLVFDCGGGTTDLLDHHNFRNWNYTVKLR